MCATPEVPGEHVRSGSFRAQAWWRYVRAGVFRVHSGVWACQCKCVERQGVSVCSCRGQDITGQVNRDACRRQLCRVDILIEVPVEGRGGEQACELMYMQRAECGIGEVSAAGLQRPERGSGHGSHVHGEGTEGQWYHGCMCL